MELGRKILAIIPARGGSKGLPRKNVLALNGKPLINYTIEAALGCKMIDRCLVSTDDEEIQDISLNAGVEVILRPQHLATDTALNTDVAKHVIDYLKNENGEFYPYFVLLQPTSPLRTAIHLENCIEQFIKCDAACAISVVEAEHSPYKQFLLHKNEITPLFSVDYLHQPRQILPVVYRQNGAIYLIKTNLFIEKKSFFVNPVMPYLMDRESSIDIDSQIDLNIASFFLTE